MSYFNRNGGNNRQSASGGRGGFSFGGGATEAFPRIATPPYGTLEDVQSWYPEDDAQELYEALNAPTEPLAKFLKEREIEWNDSFFGPTNPNDERKYPKWYAPENAQSNDVICIRSATEQFITIKRRKVDKDGVFGLTGTECPQFDVSYDEISYLIDAGESEDCQGCGPGFVFETPISNQARVPYSVEIFGGQDLYDNLFPGRSGAWIGLPDEFGDDEILAHAPCLNPPLRRTNPLLDVYPPPDKNPKDPNNDFCMVFYRVVITKECRRDMRVVGVRNDSAGKERQILNAVHAAKNYAKGSCDDPHNDQLETIYNRIMKCLCDTLLTAKQEYPEAYQELKNYYNQNNLFPGGFDDNGLGWLDNGMFAAGADPFIASNKYVQEVRSCIRTLMNGIGNFGRFYNQANFNEDLWDEGQAPTPAQAETIGRAVAVLDGGDGSLSIPDDRDDIYGTLADAFVKDLRDQALNVAPYDNGPNFCRCVPENRSTSANSIDDIPGLGG